MKDCIFSIDVEDWFHILDLPNTPKLTEWDALPSRIEINFLKLLDIFSASGIRVTCFFLGWVAEKFPRLVKEAKVRGHEIASHGYSHRLVYTMTEDEFFKDAVKSKDIIEDIVGYPILGYRSAGFSVTEQNPWFFDKLTEAGYLYDSSVFPARRQHGGMRTDNLAPYSIGKKPHCLIEFPITIANFGRPFCFSGGGYLRAFPYFFIRVLASGVLKEDRPVIFYVHPREIDPGQYRLPMNIKRRFKTYFNLHTTERKLRSIIKDFRLVTFEKFIADHQDLKE